jgi:hypothetical protein
VANSTVCVNRTPITGQINAARENRDIDFWGCGLHHTVATTPKHEQFDILLNVIAPYVPIMISWVWSVTGLTYRKSDKPRPNMRHNKICIWTARFSFRLESQRKEICWQFRLGIAALTKPSRRVS